MKKSAIFPASMFNIVVIESRLSSNIIYLWMKQLVITDNIFWISNWNVLWYNQVDYFRVFMLEIVSTVVQLCSIVLH